MAEDTAEPLPAQLQGARLAQALEHISDAYYALDRDWRYVIFNKAAEAYFGISREMVLGRTMSEVFPQGRGTPFEASLRRVMDEGVTLHSENTSILRPGHAIALTIAPLHGVGIAVILNDITERREADERMQLTLAELNHRVKNSIAVVQALARQTFATSASLAEAQESFAERLVALAAAHDVITAEDWEGADLRELIDRTLAGQMREGGRLTAEGPLLRIPPKMAVSLALALHELATNALKHGALSNERGRVALTWTIGGIAGAVQLRMLWTEQDGPPVAPPSRRGFGSRLLERLLAADLGGEVHLRFEPTGFVCEIAAAVTP